MASQKVNYWPLSQGRVPSQSNAPTSQHAQGLSQPENAHQALTSRATRRFTDDPYEAYRKQHREREFRTKRVERALQEEFLTSHVLRKDIFDRVQARAADRGFRLASGNVDSRLLQWALPKSSSHDADWNAIMHDPLLVNDATMNKLFSLRPSDAKSPLHDEDTTVFYVRTFAITAFELLRVLADLFNAGYDFNETPYIWLARLNDGTLSNEDVLYLRYFGQTDSTAFKRHRDDMWSLRDPSSFFQHLLASMNDLFPHVVERVQIQEFLEADILFEADQKILDLNEQFLIAMFGHGCANTEAGGKNIVFEPQLEDQKVFDQLEASTLSLIRSDVIKPPGLQVQYHLEQLFDDVQTYAIKNKATTGVNKRPYTDKLKNCIIQQATPRTSPQTGYTSIVLLGSDIPKHQAEDPEPYLVHGGRSADMVKLALNHFASYEDQLRKPTNFAQQVVTENLMPFVDLYPWMKKDDTDYSAATGFLRQYLRLVKPLVVVCFGTDPSSTAVGGFKHNYGIGAKKHAAHVGHLLLSNYQEGSGKVEDSSLVIVIPSYHPGVLGYSAGSYRDSGCRVFWMTMAIAWLAWNEALQRVGATELSKRKICEDIITAVNAKVGPGTKFRAELDDCIEKMQHSWSAAKGNFITKAQKDFRKARRARMDTTLDDRKGVKATVDTTSATAAQPGQKKMQRTPAYRKTAKDEGSFQQVERKEDTVRDILITSDQIVISTPLARWRQARKELAYILCSGRAQGVPKSEQRQTQVQTLWDSRYLPLFGEVRGSIAQVTAHEFEDWAKKVAEHDLFYFDRVDSQAASQHIPNLLLCFSSPPREEDMVSDVASLHDHDLLETAYTKLKSWLLEAMSTDCKLPEQAYDAWVNDAWFEYMTSVDAEMAAQLLPPDSKSAVSNLQFGDQQMSGTPVVFEKGPKGVPRLTIKFLEGNKQQIAKLVFPKGVEPAGTELRTIHFVPGGIDIHDENNKPLPVLSADKYGTDVAARRGTTLLLATIMQQLWGRAEYEAFLTYWSSQTGETIENALTNINPQSLLQPPSRVSMVIPQNWYTTDGQPFMFQGRANAQNIKAITSKFPAGNGDAAWLFNRFLLDAYPNGGEVILGDPTIDLTSPLLFAKLSEWTLGAGYKYIHHPQFFGLKLFAELGRSNIETASASARNYLGALRTCSAPKVDTARVQTHGLQRTVRRNKVTIGTEVAKNAIADDEDEPELVKDNVHPSLPKDYQEEIIQADQPGDLFKDDDNDMDLEASTEGRGSKRPHN